MLPKKKKVKKKKKSKIDLPTLFFSSLEPETQLFFFWPKPASRLDAIFNQKLLIFFYFSTKSLSSSIAPDKRSSQTINFLISA